MNDVAWIEIDLHAVPGPFVFLVGRERPSHQSYFAWVHIRKVLLGPTTEEAAIRIGHGEARSTRDRPQSVPSLVATRG
jgi:hypothetical protein